MSWVNTRQELAELLAGVGGSGVRRDRITGSMRDACSLQPAMTPELTVKQLPMPRSSRVWICSSMPASTTENMQVHGLP